MPNSMRGDLVGEKKLPAQKICKPEMILVFRVHVTASSGTPKSVDIGIGTCSENG